MSTAEATKTSTFQAKCSNLTLTKRPAMETQRALNGAVLQPADPGERVEFINHEVTVSDPETIEWLRSHPLFNTWGNNGFWEEGQAPDEPKPTISKQFEMIQRYGRQGDTEAIEQLVASEVETHNRPVVLQAARTELELIAEGHAENAQSDSDTA